MIHHLHNKKRKDLFDYSVYFFMIATPLFELLQVHAIYSSKDARSVSLWTWGFFMFSSIAWFFYGIRRRILPIVVMYSLYCVIEAVVVAGILLYS
ncbi:MAG TPA: hypothetical protein VFT87_06030 [Candidatus Saccharimonadales bacterium]|nr:hypothetical protein [Candidatus Saccharimonadales bacterium]